MLPPDQRQILLDILRPPAGYQLDGAVGTAFSLSLETALVVPLAFASFRLSGTSDPIAAMEAVRSASDRVDLFCQAGQMHVPQTASGLFAFLEPMVHEMRRPRPGHLFHPKVWLLRYVHDEEPPAVRLLCLTRNLTNDSSWDVALRLDGEQQRSPKATNKPLAEFIRRLANGTVHRLPADRRARLQELAEGARRTEWERPEHVNRIDFWPLGVDKVNQRPDFSGYRHLVVAPFLNDNGLAAVAPSKDSDVTVVSRVEDLERLSQEWLETLTSTHVVSAAADLDDPDAPELEHDRDRLSGLHAKLYVVERNRAAHIFVGSANATEAAFGGNVEFLVELTGGATKLGVERFLDPEDGLGPILEPYAPEGGADPDPIEEALRDLLEVLRSVAEATFTATVQPVGDSYLELIQGPGIDVPKDVRVTIELLTLPGTTSTIPAKAPVSAELGPVDLDQVTPFVTVRATSIGPGGTELSRASVVRCHLIHDPKDRLDEILARQVDTTEKFLRFLLLLLGITDPSAFLREQGNGGQAWSFGGRSNGIFELLLRAAADRPDVLDDLERLIPRLRATAAGSHVLPDGFADVWNVIEQARPALAEFRPRAEP
jgi:hypothetical protein